MKNRFFLFFAIDKAFKWWYTCHRINGIMFCKTKRENLKISEVAFMQLWKKTVSMLLCVGLSCSMTACDFGNNSSKDDGSAVQPEFSNGLSDSSSSGTTEIDAESFFDILSTAKSAKVQLSFQYDYKYHYETYGWIAENQTVTADIIVSENSNNGFDCKVEIKTVSSTVSADGTSLNETNSSSALGYIIDGDFYTYDFDEKYYQRDGVTFDDMLVNAGIDAASLQASLESLFSSLDSSNTNMEELIGSLNDAFMASAKVEDGALMFTLDMKDAVNSFLDYLATLNGETTLGEIVNDVLALIDPNLNYIDILDGVSDLGQMKLSDIYTALDEAFEAETGVDMQTYKDTLMMNPSLIGALQDAGLNSDQIKAIAEFEFEDFVKENGELTLDEYINKLLTPSEDMAEDSADDIENDPSKVIENACDAIKEYLSMTLAQLDEANDTNIVETIQSIASLNVTTLNGKFGVAYDNDYKVQSGIFAFNAAYDIPCENGDKDEQALTLKVTVSELSKNTVTIKLEDNAKVVNLCDKCREGWTTIEGNQLSHRDEYNCYLCDDCYARYYGEMIPSEDAITD